MKKQIVTLLSLVLIGVGCGRHQDHTKEKANPQKVLSRIVRVEQIEKPQLQAIFGAVEADRVAAVSSRVMASVVAVRVRPGDRVIKGDVLVEIDPQTAEGQEAQARGALAQAQAALTLAERNLQRFSALFAAKAASELELDMAKMHYEQAKGAVEQAQGALTAAGSVARESRVEAPFAGLVVAKLVETGDLAAPGRPLVVIQSAQGRRFVATVPESVIAASAPKLRQTVKVILDSGPNRELEGEIVEIAPAADTTTHTFTLKADLKADEVPAGLAGRLFLPLPPRPAVMIPRDAVLRVGGLTMVVLRDGEHRARSRVVSLGEADGEWQEVLSGLSGGEEVLLGLKEVPVDGALVEEV